jgi:hypothetical protein
MSKGKDPFEALIDECIKAFGIAYNDTTALDATGVIGKDRVLIIDNPRYQRETRKLRAQRTINDLKEVDNLIGDCNKIPEGALDDDDDGNPIEDAPEEGFVPEEVVVPDDEYDIRKGKSRKKKDKEPPVKPPKIEKPVRPKKQNSVQKFDKGKFDIKIRLIQQRREILDASKGGEEKETDALNIFFIPVTNEEFRNIDTVEVTDATTVPGDPYAQDSGAEAKLAIGESMLAATKKGKRSSTAFHYEEDSETGEKILVED